MKTTKNTVLAKKVQRLVDSKTISKKSLVYGWIQEIIKGETYFRPVFSQGSTWKHSTLVDKTREFETILKALNLSYKVSNDAPRGGKTGARIDINTRVIQ